MSNPANQEALMEALKIAKDALGAYANEDEWLYPRYEAPWMLHFNSEHRDGHGFETAKQALAAIDRALASPLPQAAQPVSRDDVLREVAAMLDAMVPDGLQDPAKIAGMIRALQSQSLPSAEKDADNPDELDPPELLASCLITAWCNAHGKQIPWAKAIEITAIVTKMPEEEKRRLLALDGEDAGNG